MELKFTENVGQDLSVLTYRLTFNFQEQRPCNSDLIKLLGKNVKSNPEKASKKRGWKSQKKTRKRNSEWNKSLKLKFLQRKLKKGFFKGKRGSIRNCPVLRSLIIQDYLFFIAQRIQLKVTSSPDFSRYGIQGAQAGTLSLGQADPLWNSTVPSSNQIAN